MMAAGVAQSDDCQNPVDHNNKGVTAMAKLVCVLHIDSIDGYPKSYASDPIKIDLYPLEKTVPAPGCKDEVESKSTFAPHLETDVP
jgi:hypothetical protein